VLVETSAATGGEKSLTDSSQFHNYTPKVFSSRTIGSPTTAPPAWTAMQLESHSVPRLDIEEAGFLADSVLLAELTGGPRDFQFA